MASITQRVANYLGGVSKQPDSIMLLGQVRDAINAYPDPTFGLIKRAGTKYINKIGDNNQYHTGKWFDIVRDGQEGYIACLIGNEFKVWKLSDGTPCVVTYAAGSQAYLTGTYTDYSILTVQDTTIITNKKVAIKKKPDNYPVVDKDKTTHATLVVTSAEYSTKYSVTVNGTEKSWVTRNADDLLGATDPAKQTINIDEILTKYKTEISSVLTGATITQLKNSLEISSTTPFSFSAKGGNDGLAVNAIIGQADNISQVPADSVNGRILLISNTVKEEDDYYVKFEAENGTSGKGTWVEWLKPGASEGLDPTTMPHQLVNPSPGVFEFKPIDWEPRLVGDDLSNPHPSFVSTYKKDGTVDRSNYIEQTFFYNNRLGFLSGDNVIMSQAGEYFNFYHVTALTQVAADPIDVSCSSVKPGKLHGVQPTAQGLTLFSDRQQFMMSAENGVFTPTTVSIKAISNYEMDSFVDPVDIGTEIVFISKTPSYCRVLSMVTKGQEENPVVTDIGRIVADWIPKDVDLLTASPQNEFFTLTHRDSRYLYLFRSYREAEETLLSTWVRWEMAGNVKYNFVTQDNMYFVLHIEGSYYLCEADLNQSTDENIFQTSTGTKVDPRLDLWTYSISSDYDRVSGNTKVYIPYKPAPHLTPIVVTVPVAKDSTRSGFYTTVLSSGTDARGHYYIIDGNYSTSARLVVGYLYTFQVDLPTTYYKQEGKNSDYSATLTVARYKFSVGLSGSMKFLVKAHGRSDWEERAPVIDANYYYSDGSPLIDYIMFTLPIHQKNEHHRVRVLSETPFPTSLISMVWEGNYSPRFYGRQ